MSHFYIPDNKYKWRREKSEDYDIHMTEEDASPTPLKMHESLI